MAHRKTESESGQRAKRRCHERIIRGVPSSYLLEAIRLLRCDAMALSNAFCWEDKAWETDKDKQDRLNHEIAGGRWNGVREFMELSEGMADKLELYLSNAKSMEPDQ